MIRDQRTKALINTDSDALYKYKIEREKARKLACMEQDIKTLTGKVEMLYRLLEDKIEKNNG